MKKKIVGILVCTLLITTAVLPVVGTMNEINYSNILSSSNSEVQWSNTYGGDEADKFWDVEETDDGGYIACGTTGKSYNHHPWVVKIDSDGNQVWNWTISEFDYCGTLYDITYCWCDVVMQTSDGGYLVGLTEFVFIHNDEEHVAGGFLKLDSDGSVEWMKIFGEPFVWQICYDAFVEVEDGFIGSGEYGTTLRSDRNYPLCLFKIDNMGELQWHKEYYVCDYLNLGRDLCFTNDGGFLLVGEGNDEEDFINNPWEAIVVKTDSQGEPEWNKTFSGTKDNSFGYCIQMNNGDFIFGGNTESYGEGSSDVWVMRTDVNGNEIWNKTFGTSHYDQAFDADTTDDGFIIPVQVNLMGITSDTWVIKMDGDGNTEWKHVYSEEGKQFFIGICSTSDGGCIASGISGNWDSRKSDALLVKYAPMENQRPNKPAKPSGPPKGEPDTEYTFTTSTTDPDGDSLTYMWDWGDGKYTLGSNSESYTWTSKDVFKIRVRAIDEHGGESDWSEPLSFSTPKNIAFNSLLFRFLEIQPILHYLFQRILKL